MSIEAISQVWKSSQHKGTTLLVLLAIADHAHPDGTGAYPSVATMARMARTSERNVSRILHELEAAGEVRVERGAGPGRTHLFSIPMVGAQVMPWADARRRPDRSSSLTPVSGEPSVPTRERASEGKDGLGDTGVGDDRSSPPLKESPAAPPRLSPAREARKLEDEAVRLWKAERIRRLGSGARYLDAAAIRSMRMFGVKPALAAGHIWLDIAQAIYDHAGERASAPPWKLHEWADAARAKRLDEEQAARALESRDATKRERSSRAVVDIEELRLRHPGKTLREILAIEGMPAPGEGAPRSIGALLPQLRVVSDAEAAS